MLARSSDSINLQTNCSKCDYFSFLFTALLAGTLRTYQKAGCDAEYIALSCPRGTSISIEIAQYGNTLKGMLAIIFLLHIYRILKLVLIFNELVHTFFLQTNDVFIV